MPSPIMSVEQVRSDAYNCLAPLFAHDAAVSSEFEWTVLGRAIPISPSLVKVDFVALGPGDRHALGSIDVAGRCSGAEAVEKAAMFLEMGAARIDGFARYEIDDEDLLRPPAIVVADPEHDRVLKEFCRRLHQTAWRYFRNEPDEYSRLVAAEALATPSLLRWPWMEEASVHDVGDTLASAAKAISEGRKPTRHLKRALQHLDGRCVRDARQMLDAMRAYGSMPPEWAIEASYEDARQEWDAALTILAVVGSICRQTGRVPAHVIGKFPGSWMAYARKLVGTDDAGEVLALVLDQCTDMLEHFESQVAKPLLWRRGHRSFAGSYFRGEGWWSDESSVRSSTLKLIMGERSLDRLVETSMKWHSSTTALAEKELEWCDLDEAWEPVLPTRDFDLGAGRVVRVQQLRSVGEFVAEGLAGPDSEGVPGLGHCIASYVREAYDSIGCAFLSIREVAPEVRRLSSVEMTLALEGEDEEHRIRQHRGRANVDPPPEAVSVLSDYMRLIPPMIISSRVDIHGTYKYPGLYDPERVGSVEAMFEAWGFAMPRSVRQMPLDAVGDLFEREHLVVEQKKRHASDLSFLFEED